MLEVQKASFDCDPSLIKCLEVSTRQLNRAVEGASIGIDANNNSYCDPFESGFIHH